MLPFIAINCESLAHTHAASSRCLDGLDEHSSIATAEVVHHIGVSDLKANNTDTDGTGAIHQRVSHRVALGGTKRRHSGLFEHCTMIRQVVDLFRQLQHTCIAP